MRQVVYELKNPQFISKNKALIVFIGKTTNAQSLPPLSISGGVGNRTFFTTPSLAVCYHYINLEDGKEITFSFDIGALKAMFKEVKPNNL